MGTFLITFEGVYVPFRSGTFPTCAVSGGTLSFSLWASLFSGSLNSGTVTNVDYALFPLRCKIDLSVFS